MNISTVRPNSDSGAIRSFREAQYLRQGDVFVTSMDAECWIVTADGKNAISLTSVLVEMT